LRRDLPPLVDDIKARHPIVNIALHSAVGEAPALIAAMAAHAIGLTRT
jgi:sirohydrochlorin cobaltochelatase